MNPKHKKLLVTTLSSRHRRMSMTLILTVFFLLGGMVGYSLGIVDEAEAIKAYEPPIVGQRGPTLTKQASEQYINPFELVDAKEIKFPVDQLRDCRNWSECHQLCSDPVHFPACSSWARGQELIK